MKDKITKPTKPNFERYFNETKAIKKQITLVYQVGKVFLLIEAVEQKPKERGKMFGKQNNQANFDL